MGVLDDAIREHLDLKRARGGDPAEIERIEREALGPVRREPSIGSTRFEAAEGHARLDPEVGFAEDHMGDLEELQDQGYHDSTAPHPHPHQAHPRHELEDPFFEHRHQDQFEEIEPPKRRFLRRNRPSSLPEPAPPETLHDDAAGYPNDLVDDDPFARHEPLAAAPLPPVSPLEPNEPLPLYEPLAQDEPLAHLEPVEEHELLQHHDLHEQDPPDGEASTSGRPPHLQFEQPPKRPRFTAEPPSPNPGDEAAPTVPVDEPQEALGAQETTEFDVEKHIAETRFQPDPETRVHPAPAQPTPPAPEQQAPDVPQAPEQSQLPATQPAEPAPQAPPQDDGLAGEDEDVLEETPEFLQDTPEHDRLWFEQRPPRDFDFDG